jgi:flagellar motor switch protein FliM
MLEVVFGDYEKSWKPVYEVKFEYMRSEMNTQFANIATPNEVVVTTTFNIELGAAGGELHVCMPYAMIEPIRDILYSSLQGDHLDVDKRWVRLLSKQVQSAEVELVANLGRATLTLDDIVRMKVGDVIALDVPQRVTAEVDGVPVLDCHYGVFNGQYALKVQQMIAASEPDAIPRGDKHE